MITKAKILEFPLMKLAFTKWGAASHNEQSVSYFLESSTDTQVLFTRYFLDGAALQLNLGDAVFVPMAAAANRRDWAEVKKLIQDADEQVDTLFRQSIWPLFIKTAEYETALFKSLVKIAVTNAANLKAAKNDAVLKVEVYPLTKKAILLIGDGSNARKGHLPKELAWLDQAHAAIKKVGTVKITKGTILGKSKGSLEFSSTLKALLPKLQPVLLEFTKKQVI